jgi:hypothetical protein
MSRHQFRGNLRNTIAELELDTSRVHGAGGIDFPHLRWQTGLNILNDRPPDHDYGFRSITASLYTPNLKIAEASPIYLHQVAHSDQKFQGSELVDFEFPLDMRRVEALERLRNNGPLSLRLDACLQVDEYGFGGVRSQSDASQKWGLRNIYRLAFQETIHISQSHWVEHVLPGLGYGKIHILEFPAAPIESCSSLTQSFKALSQAAEHHKRGLYDDAVAKCRLALDPFFEYSFAIPDNPKSKQIPTLKKHWEKKLGQATYDWLMNATGSLKDASNIVHHSPNNHYGQLESQMILAIATAVVAYVARTLSPEDLKQ